MHLNIMKKVLAPSLVILDDGGQRNGSVFLCFLGVNCKNNNICAPPSGKVI